MANPINSIVKKYVPGISRFLSLKNGSFQDIASELQKDPKKRVSYRIKKHRQLYIDLDLQHLFEAIIEAEAAEYPRRLILYTIYKELLFDLHLQSQLRTANFSVIKIPAAVVDKKTKEIHPELTQLLQEEWFDDVGIEFLNAEFWGHSLMEFGIMVPNTDPITRPFAPMVFQDITCLPRENVRPETGELLIWPEDPTGIPYREDPYNTWLLEAGKPRDLGLLKYLAKSSIYKRFGISDWSKSSENWNDPLLVIKSASDEDAENDKKADFAQNFVNNKWALLDIDDEVDVIDRTGGGQGFKITEGFLDYLDGEISKGVNGQTGTADEKAFVGAADVHQDILNDYTQYRLRRLFYFHNKKTIPFLISKGYKLDGYAWMPLRFLNQGKTDPNTDPNNPDNEGNKNNPDKNGSGGNQRKKP